MRHLEAREGREAVKGGVKVWRPWQLKQIELLQGVAVSMPSRQHLTQAKIYIRDDLSQQDQRRDRYDGP
jgi:hypothetical protein